MSVHVADENLVEYLDGTLRAPTETQVSRHLATCADCRLRLADIAQFDAFVQGNTPADEMTAAAMFEVGERTIAARAANRSAGRRPGQGPGRALWTLLVAALVLVGASVWLTGRDAGLELRIVRYVPDGAMRSAPPERFHVACELEQPAFVAVLARFATGDVTQLLPDGDFGEPLQGQVRLPANELLDWEYPRDRMPQALLVVAFAERPPADALAQLRADWQQTPAGAVPDSASAKGRIVRLAPFPAGR